MKKLLSIFICATIVFSVTIVYPAQKNTVYAVSKKTKAMRAYKKFLKSRSSRDKFAIAYIDNNNVPELILNRINTGSRIEGFGDLYTYKSGKMIKLNGYLYYDRTRFKYYKKIGIYIDDDSYQSCTIDAFYRLKGKKVTVKARKETVDPMTGYGGTHYYIGDKKSSKAKFKAYIKKITKGKKIKKASFHSNNAKNRNKYLK